MDFKSFFHQKINLKKDEKFLLLFLNSSVTGNNLCFSVSIETMIKMTGIGKEAIKNALLSLIEQSLVAYDFEHETVFCLDMFESIEGVSAELNDSPFFKEIIEFQRLKNESSLSKKFDFFTTLKLRSLESYKTIKSTPVKRGRGRPRKTPLEELKPTSQNSENNKINNKFEFKNTNFELNNQKFDLNKKNTAIQEIESMPAQESIEMMLDAPDLDSKDENSYIEFKDEFWKAYPRKDGKKEAYKVLDTQRMRKLFTQSSHLRERLMEGLTGYKHYIFINDVEREHIKHPATWLRGHCWEDESTQVVLNESELETIKLSFGQFFESYPNKNDEKSAKKSFFKLSERILNEPGFSEELIKQARLYANELKEQGRLEYALSASNWINSERWKLSSVSKCSQSIVMNGIQDNFKNCESTIRASF